MMTIFGGLFWRPGMHKRLSTVVQVVVFVMSSFLFESAPFLLSDLLQEKRSKLFFYSRDNILLNFYVNKLYENVNRRQSSAKT